MYREEMTKQGEPRVNHPVIVIACFENTGKIDIKAKYKGELYRNGGFVDVIESDEKLIEINGTYGLVSYYKITMPGDYQILGSVIYEGKETEAKEVSFTVPEQE